MKKKEKKEMQEHKQAYKSKRREPYTYRGTPSMTKKKNRKRKEK